jgi:hypothetical protein
LNSSLDLRLFSYTETAKSLFIYYSNRLYFWRRINETVILLFSSLLLLLSVKMSIHDAAGKGDLNAIKKLLQNTSDTASLVNSKDGVIKKITIIF